MYTINEESPESKIFRDAFCAAIRAGKDGSSATLIAEKAVESYRRMFHRNEMQ